MFKSLRFRQYFLVFALGVFFVFPQQVSAADIISGTLYSDQGVSAVTSEDKTIAILVNGIITNSGVTDANGAYSVDTGVTIVEGDVVTAFVLGASNAHGASVALVDGPIADLDVYYDHVIARHETAGSISRSDLETGNNGNADIAVLYDDDSVVFSLNNQVVFLVPAGNTMIMDSPTDSAGSFDIKGALDIGAQEVAIEGDLIVSGTLDYDQASNQEIVFDGTGASEIDYAGALPRMVINGGGTLNLSSSLDANNGILVSGGSTLDANAQPIDLEGSIDVHIGSTFIAPSTTLNVAGNVNMRGTFTNNGGEVILDSGTDQDVFGVNTYHDFTVVDSGTRIIGFEEDQTQFIDGSLSMDLSASSVVSLRTINSSGAVLDDDSQHTLNAIGGLGPIGNLDIRDSILHIGGSVSSPAQNILTSVNRGNNSGWFDLSVVGLVDGVESGLDAVFSVVASVPNNTGSDVLVTYSFGGTANPGVNNDYDDTTTSVIIPNGQSSGQIVVPISSDTNDGEGLETIEITLASASGDYDVISTPASRTITSTLIPSFDLSKSALTIQEGGQGVFDIVLNRAPFGIVTFNLSSSSLADATASPLAISFDASNWDVPQTVTVNSIDDVLDRDGDSATITADIRATPVDSGFDELASQSITATFIDNDVSDGNGTDIDSGPVVQIYRFYSKQFRGHFYTVSIAERDSIIENDSNWEYEGVFANAANADQENVSPVYRFWSPRYKHHFFTISAPERDSIIANDTNWEYEGESYYAYQSNESNTLPVFRFWSPVYRGHFYTTSEDERDALINGNPNWSYEGIAWYVPR